VQPPGLSQQTGTLALYLHIPFCDHKCAYCDFNSYAGQDQLIPAYTDALLRDLVLWREAAAEWTVRTIYFGGGTPSLTPTNDLERILGGAGAAFVVSTAAEISLEANPGTVDYAYLRRLRSIGVNRLSLGVQSFDDEALRRLDRIHDSAQAVQAYRDARSAGFDNINLDLMFGLQGQTLAGWRRTVQRAVDLAPEHLSLYALTVEPGTQLFHQVERGIAPAPDSDLQADMYEATVEEMQRAGYRHYEISNWCRPGKECAHNLVYWRNRPYLGLGAGAHSSFMRRRFAMVAAPRAYIDRVARAEAAPCLGGGTASLALAYPQIATDELVAPLTDASDTLILGLRLVDGLHLRTFAERYCCTVDELAGPALAELSSYGLIERTETLLRLSDRGRLLSNEVFVRLLPDQLRAPRALATPT
jgi:oxygen-independent coproporphyrinogen-3 oxidase